MKVVNLSQYRMQRAARMNGGHGTSIGRDSATSSNRGAAPTGDRIRMDCLHRYVKAQLLPRSGK